MFAGLQGLLDRLQVQIGWQADVDQVDVVTPQYRLEGGFHGGAELRGTRRIQIAHDGNLIVPRVRPIRCNM